MSDESMVEEQVTHLQNRIENVVNRARQQQDELSIVRGKPTNLSTSLPSNHQRRNSDSPSASLKQPRRVPPPPPPRPSSMSPASHMSGDAKSHVEPEVTVASDNNTPHPHSATPQMNEPKSKFRDSMFGSTLGSFNGNEDESICPRCRQVMSLCENVYECAECQTSILALANIIKPRSPDHESPVLTLSQIASGIDENFDKHVKDDAQSVSSDGVEPQEQKKDELQVKETGSHLNAKAFLRTSDSPTNTVKDHAYMNQTLENQSQEFDSVYTLSQQPNSRTCEERSHGAPVRLLRKAKEKEEEKKRKLERIKQQAEEEFKATHPFKPTIPKYESDNTTNMRSSHEQHRFGKSLTQKPAVAWEDKKALEEKELTFKPKVNKWPKSTVIKQTDHAAQAYVSKPVYERLSHGLSPKIVRQYLTLKEKREERDRIRREKYPNEYLSEEEELQRRKEKQEKRERRARQKRQEEEQKRREMQQENRSETNALLNVEPLQPSLCGDQSPITPPRLSLSSSSTSSRPLTKPIIASDDLQSSVQSLPPPITAFPVPTPTPSPPSSISSDSSIRSDERLLPSSSPSSGEANSPQTVVVDSPLSLPSQSGRLASASPQRQPHFNTSPQSNFSSHFGSSHQATKASSTDHRNKLVHGVKITANQHKAIFASLYGSGVGGVGATTGAGIAEVSGSGATHAPAASSFHPYANKPTSEKSTPKSQSEPRSQKYGDDSTRLLIQTALSRTPRASHSNSRGESISHRSSPQQSGVPIKTSHKAYTVGTGTPLGELHTPATLQRSESDGRSPPNDDGSFTTALGVGITTQYPITQPSSTQSPSIASTSSTGSSLQRQANEDVARQSLQEVFERQSSGNQVSHPASRYYTAVGSNDIVSQSEEQHAVSVDEQSQSDDGDNSSGESSDGFSEFLEESEFFDYRPSLAALGIRSLSALFNPLIWSEESKTLPELLGMDRETRQKFEEKVAEAAAKYGIKTENGIHPEEEEDATFSIETGDRSVEADSIFEDDERFMLGGSGGRMEAELTLDANDEAPRRSQSTPRPRRQFNQHLRTTSSHPIPSPVPRGRSSSIDRNLQSQNKHIERVRRSQSQPRQSSGTGGNSRSVSNKRVSSSSRRGDPSTIQTNRATRSISSDQLFELHYGTSKVAHPQRPPRDDSDEDEYSLEEKGFHSFVQRLKQCEKRSEERKAMLEKKYTPDFQPFLISRHKGAKLRETNINQTRRDAPTRRSRSASPYRSTQDWKSPGGVSTSFDHFMDQAKGNTVHKSTVKKQNTLSMNENEEENLRLSNQPSTRNNSTGKEEEKDADVFQRLGVFEVLRRREMAKIKAARRRSIAHYKSKQFGEDNAGGKRTSDYQQFLKTGSRPNNPSKYLIPQHLDPDECSFQPLITSKAKNKPKRSGEDMCRDALIYSEKKKQLMVVDTNKRSEVEPFKPNLETTINPEKNPSTKIVKKVTPTISLKQPTSTYIERLKEKAEAKERMKEQLKIQRELQEVEGCTFEPDLPPCPQFIHQLAEGFKKAKESSNQKKYSDIYEGKNSKYKKNPEWQTVSVTEGSVYGSRWGKVVITDPSVKLATCTRNISRASQQGGVKKYGAFT